MDLFASVTWLPVIPDSWYFAPPCRYFSSCRHRVCFGLGFGFCCLRISAGSSSLVSSSTLTLWDMCLWKCLLPISPLMRVICYASFICEEDYSVLAYNPFSGLNTPPPSPSNLQPVAKAQNAEPVGFPLPVRTYQQSNAPPCSGDGARCFTAWSVLNVWGQILFLRLAYTFLLQMVYIPRQGAVLNQLAAPCSWDKVETLSSVRSTGDKWASN